MARRLLLFVFIPALLAAAGGRIVPKATSAETQPHELVINAIAANGHPVQLEFTVNATSPEEAWDAALASLPSLLPGGRLADDSGTTAQYAAWSWQWTDAEMPVQVAYNPSGAADGFGDGSVVAVLQAWSSVPESRFRFGYAGESSRAPSLQFGQLDGENTIAWLDLDCSLGCVLGVTTKDPSAHEVEVVLNANPEVHLGVGGAVDAQSVLLHEAGHLAGLEHSCAVFDAILGSCTAAQDNAVMYYRYQGTQHSLQQDDRDGIASIYPVEGGAVLGVPGPLPVSLQQGWNLTVLPRGLLATTVSRLACVDAVYSYSSDGWAVWLPSSPAALQGLTTAEPGLAYWVMASSSCSALFQ